MTMARTWPATGYSALYRYMCIVSNQVHFFQLLLPNDRCDYIRHGLVTTSLQFLHMEYWTISKLPFGRGHQMRKAFINKRGRSLKVVIITVTLVIMQSCRSGSFFKSSCASRQCRANRTPISYRHYRCMKGIQGPPIGPAMHLYFFPQMQTEVIA